MVDNSFKPLPGTATARNWVEQTAIYLKDNQFVVFRDGPECAWLDDNHREANSVVMGKFELIDFDDKSAAMEFKLRFC